MSDKLLKASNTVWVKEQPVSELIDENVSLNRKNCLLWFGLIGLSALSVCSISSCHKNANDLEKEKAEKKTLLQENIVLKAKSDVFEMDAAQKDFESSNNNSELQRYKSFVDSIEPFYPDMPDGRSKAEKAEMEKQNAKNQKQWDDACKVLGINPKELLRLKGLER